MPRQLSPRGALATIAGVALVALAPGTLTASASFTASADAPGGGATTTELAPLAAATAVVGADGLATLSWDEPAVRPDAAARYTVERVLDGVTTVLAPRTAPLSTLPDAAPLAVAGQTVSRISMGERIACLIAEGELYCWGLESFTSEPVNTGTGDSDAHFTPVRVGGLLAGKTVTDVSVGAKAVCAVADARAYCWGAGDLLGRDSPPIRALEPVEVGGALTNARVTRVAVGDVSTCVIANDLAYCWGDGTLGRLGDGTTATRRTPGLVQGPLAGRVVTDIAVGGSHACAVSDGRAYCWGGNASGALGDGTTTNRSLPTPVDTSVMPSGTVTRVSVGSGYSCAVADARAWCWGHNSVGQLGTGNTIAQSTPTAVTASGPLTGAEVTDITTGSVHSCAVADGVAACWGSNFAGRLGDGSTTSRTTPVAVHAALFAGPVTAMSAGAGSSCAVASGAAFCWGTGGGRLGDGTSVSSRNVPGAVSTGAFPKAVCAADWRPLESPLRCGAPLVGGEATGFVDDLTAPGLPRTVSAVSVGSGGSACAIAEGIPVCWGDGSQGALGTGSFDDEPVPVAVVPGGVIAGTVATGISVGFSHACLVASGKAFCWGANTFGKLGDGTSTQRPAPVAVVDTGALAGKTVVRVAAGTEHSCAVTSDGGLACWGRGDYGELGNGVPTGSAVPVAVGGLLAGKVVTDVVPSGSSTCALAEGSVYCWGYWSRLGSDTATTSSSTPVLVTGALAGKTVTQLSGDFSAVCALADGQPYCWGRGSWGLFTDGFADHRAPWPIAMTGALSGMTVEKMFVGARGYCALATQLVCWGSSVGPSPVVAGGGALAGTSLTDVGIGESAFCAVGDGVLACWGGSTSDALLGRSDVLVSATPLEVDGSRGLAGDTCPSGWTPAGSQRCAPGAGIDVQYRVSYGKRGWTTDPVAAVIIREATP